MRQILFSSLLMIASPLAWGEEMGQGETVDRISPLRVKVVDLDSLSLPHELPDLLAQLEQMFAGIDRPLFIQRQWRLRREHRQFQAAQREIKPLRKSRDNLAKLWELAKRKARAARASDKDVLMAENAVIKKELEIVQKVEECRAHLLNILELANCEVIVEDNDGSNKTGKGSID